MAVINQINTEKQFLIVLFIALFLLLKTRLKKNEWYPVMHRKKKLHLFSKNVWSLCACTLALENHFKHNYHCFIFMAARKHHVPESAMERFAEISKKFGISKECIVKFPNNGEYVIKKQSVQLLLDMYSSFVWKKCWISY